MIYELRHLTAYSYEAPVAFATLALRLTPRQDPFQRRHRHAIKVTPLPETAARETDFYGNAVDIVTINTPHTALSIVSTARVELNQPVDRPASDTEWERIAREALAGRDLSAAAPVHFLFASPQVGLSPEVTAYARQSFPPGRGVSDGCRDLARRIHADFAYQPQTTEISTPVRQAFEQRQGVCQDFAHIMIAGLRGLGLPAAYVSGYLRTIPPPGKRRLQGADATHAWVSIWTGSENGWLGFDPTNATQTANDHIAVAIGRDFSDVSPVHGVFVGSGAHRLRVEVDVVPVAPAAGPCPGSLP